MPARTAGPTPLLGATVAWPRCVHWCAAMVGLSVPLARCTSAGRPPPCRPGAGSSRCCWGSCGEPGKLRSEHNNSREASMPHMKWPAACGCAAMAIALGCASTTDVTPMGNNTYLVGSKVVGGHMSHTEVKALALKRADEFCREQGKNMVAESAKSSGVRHWSPRAGEVVFKCE
jgi:hypothetical protein